MCLAVPGKILDTVEIGSNRFGLVEFGGIARRANLDLVPAVKVGDYVLMHGGFAISTVAKEEAVRTYELIEQLGTREAEEN
jgi:hydrogenase expression/formation protein HypC